jgi:cytochrome c biogenesis protein CcdA
MRHEVKRRLVARMVFFGGLLLMLLGCAFLLGTLAGISGISVLAAFFFIIIGSACAFLAVKLNKRSLYLFFATFFILVGFFLFLSSIKVIPMVFEKWWPSVSVFAGLALIPSGWHFYGVIKIRYLVPAVAFIILGVVLLIFSLDIVAFSFKQFILNWWPLLIVMAGLVLVLISLGTKNNPKDSDL